MLLAVFSVGIGSCAQQVVSEDAGARQLAEPVSPVAAQVFHPALRVRHESRANTRTAKNIIVFIGDGMGVSTVTASRIFDGQSKGLQGEENELPFEVFPNVALVKTYSTNQQVPDSAGTATAIFTGQKTRAGMIGVGPQSDRQSCTGARAWTVPTFGEYAESNGKATGIVTTTRVTHATPAAVYAHSAERDWESDRYMDEATLAAGCKDIGSQLVDFPYGDGIDVIFGGGRREFYGEAQGGQRKYLNDDLVAEWLARGDGREFVRTEKEMLRLRPGRQVLGLFASDNLDYMVRRKTDSSQPTLSQMTAKAIDMLEADKNGYFLLVEGGRIDHGHHDGRAGYALSETQEFARALTVALNRVDLNETLILVTADHSHTLTLSGYPVRGNPILGLVTLNDTTGHPEPGPAQARDGMPFTTLGYMNGPGSVAGGPRPAPDTGLHAKQQSLYPTNWPRIDGTYSKAATHAGEDVAIYATGPWSHLVGGVIEQDLIFHVMMQAFGWSNKDIDVTPGNPE